MLQGLSTEQRIEFVSKEDKSDPKTVVVLKPLSGMDKISLGNYLDSSGTLTEGYLNSMLDRAILEIKSPDITDKKEAVEFVKNLDILVLQEVFSKINEISTSTKDIEKN